MTNQSRDLQAELEDAITAYGSAIRLATQCFEERRIGERKDNAAEMRYWKQAGGAAQRIRDLFSEQETRLNEAMETIATLHRGAKLAVADNAQLRAERDARIPLDGAHTLMLESHCRGQQFQDCLAEVNGEQAERDVDQLLAEHLDGGQGDE